MKILITLIIKEWNNHLKVIDSFISREYSVFVIYIIPFPQDIIHSISVWITISIAI